MIDGTYQIGIVPLHRNSSSLEYYPLFSENMYLYCNSTHPLYRADHPSLNWDDVRKHDFVGLGYHSPNIELTQKTNIQCKATAHDQEAILTLILSGCYIGFLPGHYAKSFVDNGHIHRIDNELFRYDVQYSGIIRRASQPPRCVRTMMECLTNVHGPKISEERRPPRECAAIVG